jgi:hypothetical protein
MTSKNGADFVQYVTPAQALASHIGQSRAYVASAASHTCRIMASGPVISDVSNCPFLIL